jgi:hypothetical protein
MANLATKAGVEGQQQLQIHAPLITLSKAQIIQQGAAPGVDYGIPPVVMTPVRADHPAASAIPASCVPKDLPRPGYSILCWRSD